MKHTCASTNDFVSAGMNRLQGGIENKRGEKTNRGRNEEEQKIVRKIEVATRCRFIDGIKYQHQLL